MEEKGKSHCSRICCSNLWAQKKTLMFQSENESNEEDYTRSPVLLDLDENSKQQQKAASREVSSTVNQQDQGLIITGA